MSGVGEGAPGALRTVVAGALPDQRPAMLLTAICRLAARYVGAATPVAPDAPWFELGFDSMRAVDFEVELAQALALELRSTLLFDQPTPRQLADYLLTLLRDAASPAAVPASSRAAEPIAIVGAACRLPGCDDLDAFWRLLDEGRCAVGPIPSERFDVDACYDPDPNAEGRIYVRAAGIVRDLDRFDAGLFHISPREAVQLDPQQRLLLETAWHALEHANLTPARLARHRVGVYVGVRASEYFDAHSGRALAAADPWYATGNAVSTAAGRLSYTFGFTGPCYALDTACSGSLVAVHVAVRALRGGECDVALAGGANAILDPVMMAGLCRARMLAKDGRTKAFDAAADGYGRGEGAGMVVLKRLGDATAAGDRILALVLGSDVNQDGRSTGLTVPHGPSQAAVVRSALADAGVEPAAIDYVEAHGTGTALGDPIEVASLQEVFGGRERPLPIGSVKTNVGHLEPAAGITSLLKVVLAMRAGKLPATLHFQQPNPHIDWQRSIVRVVAETMPWPAAGPRRLAGVSAFGFSGTNCHVVLAGPPAAAAPCEAASAAGPWLLPLQAADQAALRALAAHHADALAGATAVPLADWCHAAGVGRRELPWRAAFVTANRSALLHDLRRYADGDAGAAAAAGHAPVRSPVAFLFPGQGAQRAGMGRELFDEEPVFRAALLAAERTLQDELPGGLLEIMFGAGASAIDRTDMTQPALCAYELALLATLRAFGVVPEAVLGHSIGDYAAAVAAEVMSPEVALLACAARGRLMVEHCAPGGMLAVLAPEAAWCARLSDYPGLQVAARNAGTNIVVGGGIPELSLLQQELEAAGIATRRLATSHAFHTAAMAPMLPRFDERLRQLPLRPPVRPFVDGRAARVAGSELAEAAFWCAHVRQPVDFAGGLRTLAQLPCRTWIELGPGPTLAPLADAAAGAGIRAISAQRSGRLGRRGLLVALAEAWAHGATVDFAAANHRTGAPAATLPGYPFQRQRHWLVRRTLAVEAPAGHPLLGSARASSLLLPGQRLFAADLGHQQPAWLGDHRVFGSVLMPGAASVEVALAAAAAAGARLPRRLREVEWLAPLGLGEAPLPMELLFTDLGDGAQFEWRAQGSDGGWRPFARGRIERGMAPPPPLAIATIAARCRETLDPDVLYARGRERQLDHGPAFRSVTRVWVGGDEVLAELTLPAGVPGEPFLLHPVLLDGCWSTLALALAATDGPLLPIRVDAIAVYERLPRELWCHAVRRQSEPGLFVADCVLCDRQGRVLASVQGLHCRAADGSLVRDGALRDLLYHTAWEPWQPRGAAPLPGRAAIVGDRALAAAVVAALPVGTAFAIDVRQLSDVLRQEPVGAVVLLATDDAPDEPERRQQQLFEVALAALRPLLATSPPVRPCLVTRGCQRPLAVPAGAPPHAASLWGLWRTLALERPALRPVAIDLDATVPAADVAAQAQALGQLLLGLGDEAEVASCCGQTFVRRLRPGAAPAGRLLVASPPFRVRAAGGEITAVGVSRRSPGPDEVEVAMAAVGLNFKDVLHARGLLPSDGEPELGLEGVGRVTAVGAGAPFQPGDAVAVIGDGTLASHRTLAAARVLALPAGVDPMVVAGAPVVFATVLHGLLALAQVRPGEVVLVHAGAGGVGQVAIAVLRRVGCRVLATCSAPKRPLVESLGATVVGDTRRLDFVAGVMAATAGRGVDVVLDSLHGDALPASLSALAIGGRLVELGKLGVWSRERVAAARPDVTYLPFELGLAGAADDPVLRALLAQTCAGLAAGRWPLPMTTAVPLAALPAACNQLAQGLHVGKLVVTLPAARAGDAGAATWLLTGGSGGLAPAIAAALFDAGVRHLALLARGPVAPAVLAELRQRADVRTYAVDVADRAALAAALQQVRATMPPIGGIVHAAGDLADATLSELDAERAVVALRPKVVGACWLDELTAADPIAQFVLLGSMAGTLGSAGQAAYAGANAFLDAFAAWRRARGRPAVAIAFGPWAGAGMAGRLDDRLRGRLQRLGISALEPRAAARLLVRAAGDDQDFAVLPVRWADWFAGHGGEVPAALCSLRASGGPPPAAPAPLALAKLPAAERTRMLAHEARSRLAAVLGFGSAHDLPSDATFRDLGLDSLLALDAKERLEQLVGVPLSATLLFDQPDLPRLLAHLEERLANAVAG